MKKFGCFFFGLVMLIAGCSSHGGGGGGGGAGADIAGGGNSPVIPARATLTAADLAGDMEKQAPLAADYSNAGEGMRATLTNGNGLSGSLGESGTEIHVRSGNSIDVLIPNYKTIEFKTGLEGDVDLYGENGKIAIGIKDMDGGGWGIEADALGIDPYPLDGRSGELTNQTVSEGVTFTGTVDGMQFIKLNSKDVDLQYSSFGTWGDQVLYSGTFTLADGTQKSVDNYSEMLWVPIYGGVNPRAPAADSEFTGKAMALVTQWGTQDEIPKTPNQHILSGDAILTVNAGNRADLSLNFADFYTIGFELAITDSHFSTYGPKPTLTQSSANHTGIVFNNPGAIDDFQVVGNFYGAPVASTASEAVGAFSLFEPGTNGKGSVEVTGSFGVKQ